MAALQTPLSLSYRLSECFFSSADFTEPWRFRVRVRASNHKIDYIIKVKEILNLEVNLNCIIGSKVTVVLLKGLILPIGGVALGRVCACSLLSRLVFTDIVFSLVAFIFDLYS